MVLSSAVPIDPPTWFAVLTIAEAIPVSCGATPWVARLKTGTNTQPMPRPVRISAGRAWVA